MGCHKNEDVNAAIFGYADNLVVSPVNNNNVMKYKQGLSLPSDNVVVGLDVITINKPGTYLIQSAINLINLTPNIINNLLIEPEVILGSASLSPTQIAGPLEIGGNALYSIVLYFVVQVIEKETVLKFKTTTSEAVSIAGQIVITKL